MFLSADEIRTYYSVAQNTGPWACPYAIGVAARKEENLAATTDVRNADYTVIKTSREFQVQQPTHLAPTLLSQVSSEVTHSFVVPSLHALISDFTIRGQFMLGFHYNQEVL